MSLPGYKCEAAVNRWDVDIKGQRCIRRVGMKLRYETPFVCMCVHTWHIGLVVLVIASLILPLLG